MTDQNEEWGPWIEHDGKGCPVPFGTFVKCVWEDHPGVFSECSGGFVGAGGGFGWDWSWYGKHHRSDGLLISRIIRYRIRKPRALSQLQDMIRNLPERIDA